MEIYVVQHVHEVDDDENVKMIGVYSTEDEAKAAVSRASTKPGFRDHPDAFQISRYELNKDHWTEGFISWEEAQESS